MGIFSLFLNLYNSDRYDLSIKEYKENKSEPWDISYWFAFPQKDYPDNQFPTSPTTVSEKGFPKNPRNSYEWYLERYDPIDEANFQNTPFITMEVSNYTSYNDAHNWMDYGNIYIDSLIEDENDMIDSLLSLIMPGSWLLLFDPLLFPEATRLYHYFYDYEYYDGMDYLQRLDFLESKVELVFYETNIEYNAFDFSMLSNIYDKWSYQTYNSIENNNGLNHAEFKEISKDEFINLYKKDVEGYIGYLMNIDDTNIREKKYVNGAKGIYNDEWFCQYAFGLKAKENAELWGHPLTGEILISPRELTKRESLYEFSKNINFFYENFDFRHFPNSTYPPNIYGSNMRSFVSWEDSALHFHWIRFISFLATNYNLMTYYYNPSYWKELLYTMNIEKELTSSTWLGIDSTFDNLPWIDIDNQKWEWLGDYFDYPYNPPTYNWIEYFERMFDYHYVYWLIDENGEISPETIKVEAKLNQKATPWFSDIDKDMKFGLTYDPNTDKITRVISYDEVDKYQWSKWYKDPITIDVNVDPIQPDKPIEKPNLWSDGTMPTIILISVIAITIISVPIIVIFKFKNK